MQRYIMTQTTSLYPGMGARPFAQGVSFRLWAPHAEQVSVVGNFNQWSTQAHPLVSEKNGYWSRDILVSKPGDEYKFVLKQNGSEQWKLDPYARDVQSSIGNAVIYQDTFNWEDQQYQAPGWHETIIYEMHIGTFNDEPGGKPGDIESVILRLPYLKSLGINMIQLMPPMEFAGGYSWGYNPAYIFAIEDDYGHAETMKRFINEAHKLGIGVIIDVVYNHFGPSDLDLWRFDGWQENDKGGIYFYNDWRSNTPWGDTRPDYGRSSVRDYIRDNALMWLEEYHADGLRWDATAYIRNVAGQSNNGVSDIPDGWSLMQWVNDEIKRTQPWKLCIAEDLRENAWICKQGVEGGAGFDSQWSSVFVSTIRDAVTVINDEDRDMGRVAFTVEQKFNDNSIERVIYTESHDEVANGKARVPEEISPGAADSWYAKKRSTLAASLVFTAPGIPMLFQGQEFLEDGWFDDKDPLDLKKQRLFSGILTLYSNLIGLRRNDTKVTRGLSGQNINVYHINNSDKLIAFHRWHLGGAGDDTVVICNFSHKPFAEYYLGFPREGDWFLRFNSDYVGYDSSFGNYQSFNTLARNSPFDNMPCSANISIAPYSTLIYSQ